MGRTLSEIKREEALEKEKAAEKKQKQRDKMAAMTAKLQKAQQTIDERRAKDARRLHEEVKYERQKYISADATEMQTSDDRASKRGVLEKSANELKDKSWADMVRRRQNHEDRKTKPCGEWRQGRCERGDGCKFKHDPAMHPLYNDYIRKNGHPPESILHFLNFDGVQ